MTQRRPAARASEIGECQHQQQQQQRRRRRRGQRGRPDGRDAEVVAIVAFSSILVLATCIQTAGARPHEEAADEAAQVGNVSLPAASRKRIRIVLPDGEDEVEDAHDIVFPDSREFEPMARIDAAPECAAGGTFCEEIAGYPYKLLRDVLGRSKADSSVLFGLDEPLEIAQRIGDPQEAFLCGAIEKTVYPKAGQTKSRKWKYIVNQGTRDGFVQGVRVETCIAGGKPCDLFGSQPNGYVTFCKQKFIYRKLVSVSDGGQPAADFFLMPSACCCTYRRDNSFLARFGTLPMTLVN